jgi:hypothetical protein
MVTLVSRAFYKWTDGLDTRQSMISIFEHIRDIPYSLVMDSGMHDPQQAPELLLSHGRGNCAPKHYLLAEMYKKLNLSVVFATFPFFWNDPDLRYPPELQKLAARLPVAYHLACRVQIGCRWVLVDATWDRPLAQAGFPVNEHWDGYADTKCAVKPLRSPVRTAYCRTATSEPCRSKGEEELCPLDGEKNHWDADDRYRYYNNKLSIRTQDEEKLTAEFYRHLDRWLEIIRKSCSDQ